MDIGGSVPVGESGRAVRLTTPLYIVSRLRIRGAIPPLTHIPSWQSHELNLLNEFPSFNGT